MRAIGFGEIGGPEVLGVVDIPERHAGPGEMGIRVHAATVNPTDTMYRSGFRPERFHNFSPPFVPGMDAAGVLCEIGADVVTDLEIGDPVMAIVVPAGTHGAYAESIVVPAGSVARAPAGTTHVEAATLPMNGLTARLALDKLGLEPGCTVAVTGAAGAFGGYTVQLAKADGLRVLADASESDEALVRELGADIVVRRGDDVGARFREAAPDGVDGMVDGAVQHDLVVSAIRRSGGLASVRDYPGDLARDIAYHRVLVSEYAQHFEALDRLRRQAEAGEIILRVARTFPATDAAEAHRLLEAGGVRGRLVLEF